jgi:choice-of-anchor A domain-containing protein
MKHIAAFTIAMSTLSAPAFAATLSASELLSQYNLITLQDLTFSSHTNGRVFVGGDLTSNNAVFYDRNSGPASDFDEVVVAGNVTGNNLQVGNSGNVAVGGNVNLGVLELNGGGTANVGGALVATANQGTKNQDVGNIADYIPQDVTSVLQGTSAALASETTNSTASLSAGKLLLSGAGAVGSQAVFSINLADFDLISEVELILGGASSMIINVSGATATLADNFLGASRLAASSVIWNFYDATALNFTRTFEGTVLAPFANVTSANSNFEGTLVALNANLTGEVHAQYYTGTLPQPPVAAVPLPAGLPLLGAGLLMLGALRRKKRA